MFGRPRQSRTRQRRGERGRQAYQIARREGVKVDDIATRYPAAHPAYGHGPHSIKDTTNVTARACSRMRLKGFKR